MKLALVLFDYFSFGGLQRGCFMVAEEAARRGHEVKIFAGMWKGDHPRGASVEVLGNDGWSNISRNKFFYERWRNRRRTEIFDAVIGFNKLPGLDIYYASDSCYAARIERLKPRWYRWTPRYRHFQNWEHAVFQRGARAQVLALSEAEIPQYRRIYGSEPERFHVLPPGLARRHESDADRARLRNELRKQSGWREDELILLLVGSGFRTKGLDRAIRGLAALPDSVRQRTRLVVVGDDKPGRYAWLAKSLNVRSRVEFLGGQPNVYSFLCAADLLVHPAYAENTGNVLLESMTAGLPVLASGVCGYAHHVVTAQAGKIIGTREEFSQDEFNRAVAEMLASPQCDSWRQNGLRYAATSDLYSRREKAVDVIETIVTERKKLASSRTPAVAAVLPDSDSFSANEATECRWEQFGKYKWLVRPALLNPQIRSVLSAPEEFLNRAKILKAGGKSTLGGANGLVLKRYNFSGWFDAFRNRFRPSRSRLVFERAFHLERAGIRTARALAATDAFIAGLPVRGFFLMQEIPRAISLHLWRGDKRLAAKALGELLAQLHRNGFAHRDIKDSNILFDAANRPHLIDLDGLRGLRRPPADERAATDLARLARGAFRWQEKISRTDRLRFLRVYCRMRELPDWRWWWKEIDKHLNHFAARQ